MGGATKYSDSLSPKQFPPDGLLGMGYQTISDFNSPPFVQTLIAQGKTTQPVFAFKLASSGSELYIGGVNSALYTGSFTYAPVTTKVSFPSAFFRKHYLTSVLTKAYWQVNMDSATANGKPSVGSVTSIIDTGTTLVIGDNANVKKFYATIPGAKAHARNF